VVRTFRHHAQVLKIISADKRGRDDYVRMPVAAWDPGAEHDSWLELSPLRELPYSAFRRLAGLCDIAVWQRVSRRHGIRDRTGRLGGVECPAALPVRGGAEHGPEWPPPGSGSKPRKTGRRDTGRIVPKKMTAMDVTTYDQLAAATALTRALLTDDDDGAKVILESSSDEDLIAGLGLLAQILAHAAFGREAEAALGRCLDAIRQCME
jgi:hypothetical protein